MKEEEARDRDDNYYTLRNNTYRFSICAELIIIITVLIYYYDASTHISNYPNRTEHAIHQPKPVGRLVSYACHKWSPALGDDPFEGGIRSGFAAPSFYAGPVLLSLHSSHKWSLAQLSCFRWCVVPGPPGPVMDISGQVIA